MPDKWNQRYSKSNHLPKVNPWLSTYKHLLPTNGSALDLACGLGQNAFFLAKQGLNVQAWDISEVAIKAVNDYALRHRLEVKGSCLDVTQTWPASEFDLIYVSAYLQRNIYPQIISSLKPNGTLFYQTFNQIPLTGKPSNNNFLLQPGELLTLFSGLVPLVYLDEQELYLPDKYPSIAGQALLIARK
ncbi:MAG: methyltransferase domain-containing protein [Gammaproteobacteria bacterium]|jgi:2-polyprenyl-3-methyl-5-hydroxy-6-metoxy-1,4-benzoquinol methylase|nr:methyltransferase domain-containing protein [Gammaproteobacteria bacterium]